MRVNTYHRATQSALADYHLALAGSAPAAVFPGLLSKAALRAKCASLPPPIAGVLHRLAAGNANAKQLRRLADNLHAN